SRATSAVLVSAGVGSSAWARAWPRAAMIGCSGCTLRWPLSRLVPPCTTRQGSPSVQATAPRAYRQVASCQLIQSSTRPWASSESRRTASSRTGRRSVGVGAEASLAGSARSPARIRRGFALSVSIEASAYTRLRGPDTCGSGHGLDGPRQASRPWPLVCCCLSGWRDQSRIWPELGTDRGRPRPAPHHGPYQESIGLLHQVRRSLQASATVSPDKPIHPSLEALTWQCRPPRRLSGSTWQKPNW